MKRLIEVALPIKEISAESVRDKSLRHGHISTLHLWWARRPLSASRAIVFASLVPDPDDAECPQEFKNKVNELLGSNPNYKPYNKQDDTLRNRLLTFIAKWSQKKIDFDEGNSLDAPETKELLDDNSLVKWESSINPKILKIARELIYSAYGYVPTVLDPFAGGGAIPLEAVRLGCNVIANDYNPVAHLIERCTFEFPYKYGRPGEVEITIDEAKQMGIYEKIFPETEMHIVTEPQLNYGGMDPGENWFELNYGNARLISKENEKIKLEVSNKLVFDVERHAKNILERVREKIAYLYPAGSDGNPVIGYLWARTAPCSNPSCGKEIPLLRSLIVCDKKGKRVALTMNIENGEIKFGIAKNKEIKRTDGTMLTRGNVKCPFCNEVTPVADLRTAGLNGKMREKMTCVITATNEGKDYRPVEEIDLKTYKLSEQLSKNVERPSELILPEITSLNEDDDSISNSTGIRVHLYGYKTWGSLFNSRQLLIQQSFSKEIKKVISNYSDNISIGILTNLSLLLDRVTMFNTSFGIWVPSGEFASMLFGRQAIPIVWDYPEVNVFSNSFGSYEGQLDWVLRVIDRESIISSISLDTIKIHLGDASLINEKDQTADIVITDPPYFDAISYADLSDFFYVWLKRTMIEIYPEAFSTPLTPKTEEATALKHRHNGNAEEANKHFEDKLSQSLIEAKRLCKDNGVISIMFAHQSTHAWSALINAIFKSGLTVTATYPIDTEDTGKLKLSMSALSSSVTVVCRPRVYEKATTYLKIRSEIENVVKESVERFWGYGFRGADLIVACYGPAVSVVGKYEYVEKQGEPIPVADLLNDVREIALKTIAGAFTGDLYSRFYFVVANMYGVAEMDWDDIVKIAQIGSGVEDARIFSDQFHYIIREENKARLAMLTDRIEYLPEWEQLHFDAPLIDQLHIAMLLWKQQKRPQLVQFLSNSQRIDDDRFWKLAQSLFELDLLRGTEDWKLINSLLSERETLKVEVRRSSKIEEDAKPKTLFDE